MSSPRQHKSSESGDMNRCSKHDQYDYIIVGSGSAGCTIAAKLITLLPHNNIRIALIEGGPEDCHGKSTDVTDPLRAMATWGGPLNRGYRTVPQPALNNRKLSVVRASGVGGCSLQNFMLWYRGFADDWDKHHSASNGRCCWSSEDIRVEMEWIEQRLGITTLHATEMMKSVCDAARRSGIPDAVTVTSNGFWDSTGISRIIRTTISSAGTRQDIYRALGADHERITLLRGTVERILFDDTVTTMARGVLLRTLDGSQRIICLQDDNKKAQVIVSCGAIDTPKLLQLSGIGPPDLLRDLNIPLVHPLPQVGEGLRDHPLLPMAYATKKHPGQIGELGISASLYDDNVQILLTDGACNVYSVPYVIREPLLETVPSAYVLRRALCTFNLMAATLLGYILTTVASLFPFVHTKFECTLGFLIGVMKPQSVGSVHICSADPTLPPEIHHRLLAHDKDWEALQRGIDKVQAIVKHLDIVKDEPLLPLDPRVNAGLYHHSTGTCSVGPCLDHKLRVHGIQGLRVADASALPFHPRVPTQASVMAVGARCATLLAEEYSTVDSE